MELAITPSMHCAAIVSVVVSAVAQRALKVHILNTVSESIVTLIATLVITVGNSNSYELIRPFSLISSMLMLFSNNARSVLFYKVK